MENPSQRPGGFGTFMKGFFSSAGSGALMSGIFYGIALLGAKLFPAIVEFTHIGWAPTLMGTLGGIAGPIALMVLAVGVFGGVMATMREKAEAKEFTTITRSVSREQERSAEPTPVLVPMVGTSVAADRAEDAAPRASWVSRTGGSDGHRDRIQQILNNGSMSDKDRAGAILAEREASASQQQQI